MRKQSFRATLLREGGKGSWATLTVPFRVEEVFGTRTRVPVKGTLNGVPFRNSLMPNGDGTHYLVVNGSLRAVAGIEIGDTVDVVLQLDGKPKNLELPRELADAIDRDTDAKRCFENMPPSHQREYVEYVAEAKKPETRARRVEQTVAKLRESGQAKKGR
jgi:hypothetical protein